MAQPPTLHCEFSIGLDDKRIAEFHYSAIYNLQQCAAHSERRH